MRREHVRPRRFGHPVGPQRGEIIDPDREILDMAGHRILAQPPRARLSAPVGRRHPPAGAVPFLQRFEIFLVGIAAPGQEQNRTAHGAATGTGPVDPAQAMAIGRVPEALARGGRNGSAIDRRSVAIVVNLEPPSLVTFW